MIKPKKKICKSCGNECILFSKGRCKSCSLKEDSKPIKKNSRINKISVKGEEKKAKKKEYTEKQFKFFLEIWNERPHYCQSCNKYLGNEPLSLYFDHLIEKSKRPDLALEEWNIFICCGDCHSLKTNGFPTENHKKAIERAKIWDKLPDNFGKPLDKKLKL